MAREQKLTCVFDKGDASMNQLGMSSVFLGEGAVDITPLVEKKLGLPSAPAALNN